ncbi:protein of unknown function [Thalassospira xiamenensis M-5 = DSM 17429]|nr:protein of unknown function [Thalassospira xiamenensis M-5 = DSM 17429]
MTTVKSVIEQHGSSAPVNIEQMIRDLGIELDKEAKLSPEISGQIEMLENDTYKISANGDHHYYRRRFTMAHELAHYILHRDLIGRGLDDNQMYRSTVAGNFYNPRVQPSHEIEANQLAADLLVPGKVLRKLWESGERNLEKLAKQFQVSKSAMEIRLKTLNLK